MVSRKGDAARRQRYGSHELSALLGKPAEGFSMSRRKSGGRAAALPSPPEIVCVLVVDNTFDEFEVEICCQRTDGVDRAFSTSKDLNWLRAERPSESTLSYSVETLLFGLCLPYCAFPRPILFACLFSIAANPTKRLTSATRYRSAGLWAR